jgi:hypothetical protein
MAKTNFLDSSKPLFSKPISMGSSMTKDEDHSGASQYFGYLFSVRDQAHLAHLRVSGLGAFAAHMALGEFYDGILDKTDQLIEVYQGMNGIIPITIPGSTYVEPLTLVKGCREYVKQNRFNVCDCSHVQNIIDELIALTDRTIYKLENLK